ncbi:MAG: TIGR03000 domain-containing protein [Gemmataceae bacterium]|nr:TIGR03000 domain-containing protein [Gemmataceae bacterium]
MYSIVMIAAMTAAPEAPDFHKRGGGCTGAYYTSCTGCSGGVYYSGRGCTGCQGAVTVYSSCIGSCTGCYGGYARSGCCGGYSYHPGVNGVPSSPVPPAVVVPVAPAKDPKKDAKDPKGAPGGISATDVPIAHNFLPANRGQVLVFAPANAKLFADGHATTLTGTERTFQTPALAEGKDFHYTLKIEFNEGTETKSVSKQVLVRAGHRTVVDFTVQDDKTSSAITVNLPTKAKLFVDGTTTPATGGKHVFRTPELTRGKPYVYQFRAEVERDGKTEVESREVNFRGGDAVVVDFSEVNPIRTASAK